MSKLICEDWQLYDLSYKGVVKKDTYTGEDYVDVEGYKKNIRVFGTRQQIKKLSKRYNIDEVWKYEKIEAGSYWDGIVCNNGRYNSPTLEEYNNKVDKKYIEYTYLYKLNNNKILII